MNDKLPEVPNTFQMPTVVMRALPGGFLQLEIKGVVPVEIGAQLMSILAAYRDSRSKPDA